MLRGILRKGLLAVLWVLVAVLAVVLRVSHITLVTISVFVDKAIRGTGLLVESLLCKVGVPVERSLLLLASLVSKSLCLVGIVVKKFTWKVAVILNRVFGWVSNAVSLLADKVVETRDELKDKL